VLAERAGIELEREAEDPRDAERRARRERLLALLERSAAYYVRVLWESDEAAPAREYLAGRGLEEGVLREFRVGFSPRAWDRVAAASARSGYTESELLAAGLALRRREGPGLIDRFRGRIMFPLADVKGHVLGFGARALIAGDRPKYLNTSDSDLFHKGSLVYGADLARAPAARAGRLVLVEGYTDVIALRQAGIPETVCSMGTALTERQLDAIARLTPKVLLCQDPDAAGQEAAAKGKDAIRVFNETRRGRPLDLRVVRLPPGEDPADVVQRSGAEAMRALLEKPVPVARFEVERALDAAALDTPEGRDDALRAVAPIVGRLEPGPLQYDLIQLIANRLQMPEAMTSEALRRAPRANGRAPASAPSRMPTSVDLREDTERLFLARCLAVKEAGRRALAGMDVDAVFSGELTRRAAHYLVEHLDHPGEGLPPDADALAKMIAELVIRSGDLEADATALELERLQLDKNRLSREIAAAERAGESVIALSVQRQQVQAEISRRLH
jgi:DNA primase